MRSFSSVLCALELAQFFVVYGQQPEFLRPLPVATVETPKVDRASDNLEPCSVDENLDCPRFADCDAVRLLNCRVANGSDERCDGLERCADGDCITPPSCSGCDQDIPDCPCTAEVKCEDMEGILSHPACRPADVGQEITVNCWEYPDVAPCSGLECLADPACTRPALCTEEQCLTAEDCPAATDCLRIGRCNDENPDPILCGGELESCREPQCGEREIDGCLRCNTHPACPDDCVENDPRIACREVDCVTNDQCDCVDPEGTRDCKLEEDGNDECTIDHWNCQTAGENNTDPRCSTNPECCSTDASCNRPSISACQTLPSRQDGSVNEIQDYSFRYPLNLSRPPNSHGQLEDRVGIYGSRLIFSSGFPLFQVRNMAQVVLVGMVYNVLTDPALPPASPQFIADMRNSGRCINNRTEEDCNNAASCQWCDHFAPVNFDNNPPFVKEAMIKYPESFGAGSCFAESPLATAACALQGQSYFALIARHYLSMDLAFPAPEKHQECFERNYNGKECSGECAICYIPNIYGLKFSDDWTVQNQPQRIPLCHRRDLLFPDEQERQKALALMERENGTTSLTYRSRDMEGEDFTQRGRVAFGYLDGWCTQLQDITGNPLPREFFMPWMIGYDPHAILRPSEA